MLKKKNIKILFLVLSLAIGASITTITILMKESSSQNYTFQTQHVTVPAGTIPPSNGDSGTIISTGKLKINSDGYINSFTIEPINAAFEDIQYLHILDSSQKDPLCASEYKRIDQRGPGYLSSEKNKISYPQNYGYPLKKNAEIIFSVAFINSTDIDFKNVYLKIKTQTSKNLKPLTTIHLNTKGCPTNVLVPPKSNLTLTTPKEYIMEQDSEAVIIQSHTHNFADSISLLKNGQKIWLSTPDKNKDGNKIKDNHFINLENGIKLKKGDKLMAEAKYTNTSNAPTDASGTLLLFIK